MKITKGDIIITDVPGIVSITVKRHPDAAAGVRIIIEDSRGEPMDWGLDGLTQYRDALSAAIDAARELSGQKDVPSGVWIVTAGGGKSSATGGRGGNSSGEPRVFRVGDVIPNDVVKVRDREGDLWAWDGVQWKCLLSDGWASTDDLLEIWAPVTEVRD